MIEYLETIFMTYGYWLIFVGTILDHSGIPMLIVFGGVMAAQGNLDILGGFIVCLLALQICDIILLFFGRYLLKIYRQQSLFQRTKGNLSKTILDKGVNIFEQAEIICYLLSKWLPAIGKYFPVIIGYGQKNFFSSLIFLLVGNILYTLSFYLGGYWIGISLVTYSKTIAFSSVILFIVLYFCIKHIIKSKIEVKGWK